MVYVLLGFFFMHGAASAQDCNPAQFAALKEITAEDLTKNIDVIWYPKTKWRVITHMDLVVDGTVWNPAAGFKSTISLKAVERLASSGRRGLFRFQMNVTEGELANLKSYLNEHNGKFALQSCSGGACRAIHSSTGIKIPFPITQVPTLMAAYLAVLKKMGNVRVAKIEYMGKNPFLNLLSTDTASELLSSATLTALGGALVVTILNDKGEAEQEFIPLTVR